MKKLFILLFTLGLFASCNDDNPFARKDSNTAKDGKEEKSDPEKKGKGGFDFKVKNSEGNNWSKKQADEWRDKCLSEYRDEPNAKQMCDCMIDKIGQKYPDENDAKEADEDDLDKLIKDCEARFQNDNNDNGGYVKTVDRDDNFSGEGNSKSWTKLQRQTFIQGCATEAQRKQGFTAQQANTYCDCMTRKAESKYSFDQAARLTPSDIQTQEWINAEAECRSRIY